MANANLRVRVYGARGSYSPTDGRSSTIGVNTTCIRVDTGKNVLIFDAGSGIINCGRDLLREINQEENAHHKWTTHLIFTHMHIDHLVGFPYFAMLYMPHSRIHFIAPQILDYRLEDVLNTFMHPPFFPVGLDELPFEANYHQIAENKTVYFFEEGFAIHPAVGEAPVGWIARIRSMRNYMHPKGGSYFYRIELKSGESVVLASDTEGFVGGDQRLIRFAQGADVLFHDAQYIPENYGKFQGFGHSTYEMACEIAEKAEVKTLYLIHHDPNYDDNKLREVEMSAQKLFARTYVASESVDFVL